MIYMMRKILIVLFLLSLTACSYSPNSLKEAYKEFASDISSDLKEPIDLSPQQEATVDDYVKKMMRWHRSNKLPEYAQTFAQLASYVQMDNPSVSRLQASLKKINDIPHFEQAKHLTPMITDVAKTLSKSQISQLVTSLNEEYQKERHEIKSEKQATVIEEGVNQLFSFIEVPLNQEQRKIIKAESKKFHDLRGLKLQSERKLEERFIVLLRQPHTPHFSAQFSQLWNSKAESLKGKALQHQQQNDRREASLLKKVIMKFNTDKKNKLASKLTSISYTFSEMANE